VFRTIKAQILLISATLVLLLLSQVFLSRNSQLTFVDSLELTQQAITEVNIVRKLERDIIDLQRNVLIYKESASRSSISRFHLLMDENQSNLTRLEQLATLQKNREMYLDYITRMRTHLSDYKENFDSVVTGRTKRQLLYNNELLTEFETLFSNITINQSASQLLQAPLEKVKYHVARAEIFLLQYLQMPDQHLVESFQQQLLLAKLQINKPLESNKNFQAVMDRLTKLESDFLQLTHITRGYSFLVNVVMAGSANEFLFLARELNRLVTEQLSNTNADVEQVLDNTRIGNNLFSIVGIIIAAATALFMIYRIMLPINTITNVFQRLTKGENVDSIPGLNRKDEIGLLARAADVFHETNKQTATLLEQSQLLNAKQEALNTELVTSNQKV
jgi:HAMP domain-containing protein